MYNIQPGMGVGFSGSREIALGLGPLTFVARYREYARFILYIVQTKVFSLER